MLKQLKGIWNMITINGKTYTGGNITISNNVVKVNGTVIDMEKALTLQIEGNVESIDCDYCNSINVTGSAGKINTMSGDVRCGDVKGSVKTMSGDVDAKEIHGDVDTMSGDISK